MFWPKPEGTENIGILELHVIPNVCSEYSEQNLRDQRRRFIDVFQQYQWTSRYIPDEGIEPQVKKAYIWLAMSALLGEMPSAADWVA